MTKTIYPVRFWLFDGRWLAQATELEGVRTEGRSLSTVQRGIREAIAAAEDIPEDDIAGIAITERYDLGKETAVAMRRAQRSRARAEEAQRVARLYDRQLVFLLRAKGLSLRDIATVVGCSHTQAWELAEETS